MPPKLNQLLKPSMVPQSTLRIQAFLLPFLNSQTRSASILSNLSNLRKSYGHKKRVGRGPASGKGKTSGRGYNGQGQRGHVPFVQSLGRHFEGGQTPVEVVHGKSGFVNNFTPDIEILNLSKLVDWINSGRIDPTRPITPRELLQSKCVGRPKDGIKLLADGKETLPLQPLRIITSRASAQAIEAVEARGGRVATRYYTKFALQQILNGRMDPVHSLRSQFDEAEWGAPLRGVQFYRLPDATSRKALEYYRDQAHRGYLSHTVPEGENPSLFFKTPGFWAARAAIDLAETPGAGKRQSDNARLF